MSETSEAGKLYIFSILPLKRICFISSQDRRNNWLYFRVVLQMWKLITFEMRTHHWLNRVGFKCLGLYFRG